MSEADNAVLALCRSMYGKRITEKQYDELLSMKNPGEIAAYLKSKTPYVAALEASAGEWTAKSLGEAVERYFFSCFNKICRFEIAAGLEFYRYFLAKNEIDQILECTMLILGGRKGAYLRQMNSFLDKYLSIDLFALGKAQSAEDISACLEKTPYKKVFDLCLSKPDYTYLTFENGFNAYLCSYQNELIKKCFKGKAKQEVLSVLSRQYDVKLIESMTRLIRYYSIDSEILSEILPSDISLFNDSRREKLLSCKTLAELDSVLAKSPYRELAFTENEKDITGRLNYYLYSYYKKQLRFSENPCVVMLCFLSLCKTEKNNIIKIIQGNKYSMPPEEIRQSLCI